MMSENVTIRPATIADEPVLWAMLYQAIYIPPGATAPPRDILRRPELSRYVEGWSAPDDIGFVAEAGGQPVPGIFDAVPYCIDLICGPYLETRPEVCKAFRPQGAVRGR